MQPEIIEFDSSNQLHHNLFSDLNREWLEKYFYVEPEDEVVLANPVTRVVNKGGIILFVAVDGVIVGTGTILQLNDGSVEIAKMAVTEAFQGKGIGTYLLKHLIDRVKKIKPKGCYIVSNTSLATAIALYRKHGFVDSAENRHSHYERGDITLQLDLTAA